MYLTSCEPAFAYERFDMSTPAYHALYQGDLEAFLKRKVSGEWTGRKMTQQLQRKR